MLTTYSVYCTDIAAVFNLHSIDTFQSKREAFQKTEVRHTQHRTNFGKRKAVQLGTDANSFSAQQLRHNETRILA